MNHTFLSVCGLIFQMDQAYASYHFIEVIGCGELSRRAHKYFSSGYEGSLMPNAFSQGWVFHNLHSSMCADRRTSDGGCILKVTFLKNSNTTALVEFSSS